MENEAGKPLDARSSALREALADYAHKAWSNWMFYLFSRSQGNADGSVTIPADLVERWKRQVVTPYDMLPENEKASDRKQADQIVDTIVEYTRGRVEGGDK